VSDRGPIPATEALALRREIERQNKIIVALMDRAERSTNSESSDFATFQSALMLEAEVQARTAELTAALRENERMGRALRESETTYRSVITAMVEGVMFQAADGRIVALNPAAERILGRRREEIIGLGWDSLPWPTIREDGSPFPCDLRPGMETLRSGEPETDTVMGICKPDGVTWITANSQPMLTGGASSDDPDRAAVVSTFSDITRRKCSELHERLRSDILEKLARGVALHELLAAIAGAMEAELPGCLASINLLDEQGRLHPEVAPSLPVSFVRGIDGLASGEGAASCGTAAHRGQPVIVADIGNHPCWRAYRTLAADAGLAACWSLPVIDAQGKVVATVAMYWRTPREPGSQATASLVHAAHLVSIAIGHHRDEKALRDSEAKFSAIFGLSPEPLALTRLRDGRVLDVSDSFVRFFGHAREDLVGRTPLPGDLGIWTSADDRLRWKERLQRDGEVMGFEARLRRKDGSAVTALVSGRIVRLGDEACVISDAHDITEQKQQALRLEQIAHHDALTGLPNRLLLGDRLRQAIAQNQRAGNAVAVCYLDLDGFKRVNDTRGHEAGDRLLKEIAQRLLASVRAGDTVARLGGDEFVLLLCGLSGDDECRVALDRIVAAVSAPVDLGDGQPAQVTASVGVTRYPDDRSDPDAMVRNADHAMYIAKQNGKNRYHFFDSPLANRGEARRATLSNIGAALAAGQLELHYQPKIDCRTGVVTGVEALLRWRHPTLGVLMPDEFLPLIEDNVLGYTVGHWVLAQAWQQSAAWCRAGLNLPLSINAFARQLVEPGFTERVAGLIKELPDARAGLMSIEVVESCAIRDMVRVREVMHACAELGIGFALDDFGLGVSSLTGLRCLPAQEIKIDRSFIHGMLTQADDLAVVEAVIGLGRAFRRSVVAEGVETHAQVVRLLGLGCRVMQGYLLAPPMPAGALDEWMRAYSADRCAPFNSEAQASAGLLME
jgi:diguanylate cyclase (GGDEF)-like protein/PAS domain S-box-containing protein